MTRESKNSEEEDEDMESDVSESDDNNEDDEDDEEDEEDEDEEDDEDDNDDEVEIVETEIKQKASEPSNGATVAGPTRSPAAMTSSRKVMQVRTPGALPVDAKLSTPSVEDNASPLLSTAKKRRGRPTRAEMAEREKDRQEAIARGEPDPELKRKRRKPNK